MRDDEARPCQLYIAANDNEAALRAAKVDAALIRIAEAMGRHIAREHIARRPPANDNEPRPKNVRPPER